MFQELLARIASALQEQGIPYMVIGGQAVLLHGEPRLTRDIDITLGIGLEKTETILRLLRKLSLKPLPEDPAAFAEKTMVMPAWDEKTGIRVDFIFSFTPYEQEAMQRGVAVMLHNVAVNFISAEDLIIHKVFSRRPRDIEDAKNILIKNPSVDASYIEKRLAGFDQALEGDSFLNTFRQLRKEIREARND